MDAKVHIHIATVLGRARVASPTLGAFNPWEGPGTHFIGGLVYPRTSLDTMVGKNYLILPEDQVYSSLLGSKISDLIFVLNFFLSG